jgi:hypothetical protein
MPLIFPPMSPLLDQDGNPLAKLPAYQAPTVGNAPYNGGIDPSQSPGGVLGSVGLSDPSTGLDTTGPVGRSAPTPSTNPLGSVQDIGRPTVESRQMRMADQDFDDLQAKRDAYAQPAQGILGHVGHFFRPSLAFEEAPIRARIADDEAGLRQQQQLNLASNKEQDENAEKGTPEYQAAQQADLEYKKATTDDKQAQADATTDKVQVVAAKAGLKPQTNADGSVSYVPDENSPVYKQQQAVTQYKQAQTEYESAQQAYREAQTKNLPEQMELAKQRIALARENAYRASQSLGFQEDKFYNPQPTGTEINKGELAQSTIHQINTLRDVVNRRGDLFGPGPGRANHFQQWVGSSDPDAVTYRAASQYLSDHSMGMFGARSEYINKQLHDLTDERFTPDALNAALDQAQSTAQGFVNAGTVHKKGGTSSYSTPASGATPGSSVTVTDPTGKPHNFPDQASADAFKKAAGIR